MVAESHIDKGLADPRNLDPIRALPSGSHTPHVLKTARTRGGNLTPTLIRSADQRDVECVSRSSILRTVNAIQRRTIHPLSSTISRRLAVKTTTVTKSGLTLLLFTNPCFTPPPHKDCKTNCEVASSPSSATLTSRPPFQSTARLSTTIRSLEYGTAAIQNWIRFTVEDGSFRLNYQ